MAKLAIDVVLNKAAAMTGLRGLEKDVTSFGKSMLGIVGIGGGIAGIVAGIDGILAKAGQLQDVSDAFNVSAESIQRLANVAVTANLSVEEIGSKLGKLGKAAQEAAGGNEKLKEAFVKINVKGQELVSLNPEQLFDRLREAISSGALAGEDLSIVNDLLAKDYQRFLPLLRMTAEEYKNLGNSSAVLSDVTVSNLDAMNVKLRQFQNTISTVAALYLSEWVDLLKDFKENPFATVSDQLTGDFDRYEKRIQERANKVKEMIRKERATRAGQEKTVQDEQASDKYKKELDEKDRKEVQHLTRMIDAQVKSKEQAEKMKADIEEKYRQRSLDREIEMEKNKNEQKIRLQDMLAREQGPQAEVALLESRAQDAAKAFQQMPSTDSATALAEARGAFKDALLQQIKDSFPNAPGGFAESQAQQMLSEKGLAADLSGFAKQTEPSKPDVPMTRDFFASLKTDIEEQLKQDGMQANMPEFTQNMEMFRPLQKVPDIAAEVMATSRTLGLILEEIRKGDGSVFR